MPVNGNPVATYTPVLATDYSRLRDEFDETNRDFLDAIEEVGVGDKVVLDLGCGDGRHAVALVSMGARHVTGIDVSEKMIDLARRRANGRAGVRFLLADGMQIPINDESVGLVVANFVVHYFADSSLLFHEVARVLRGDGTFIGTFNVCDVKPGFEYLYDTPMPIRLGRGKESVVVPNLIKSRADVLKAVSASGLVAKKELELHHPNAEIDDSFDNKQAVVKHALLLRADKQRTVIQVNARDGVLRRAQKYTGATNDCRREARVRGTLRTLQATAVLAWGGAQDLTKHAAQVGVT